MQMGGHIPPPFLMTKNRENLHGKDLRRYRGNVADTRFLLRLPQSHLQKVRFPIGVAAAP